MWTPKFILLVDFHPSHFSIASSCTRVYSSPARCRLLPWARGYLFEEYPRPFTQTATGWKGVLRFDGFSMVINWVFLVISFSPWTEASRWSKSGWQFVSHTEYCRSGSVPLVWCIGGCQLVCIRSSSPPHGVVRRRQYDTWHHTFSPSALLHRHCSSFSAPLTQHESVAVSGHGF